VASLVAVENLAAQARTQEVTAGPQYGKPPYGGTKFLGKDYRDLWTTPIEVEVLDLATFAGGLKPVMRVGGLETLGLALKGQDGRDYTFRSVDKEYSEEIMPPAFRGTLVADIIQDQIAANFPGVQVVTAPMEKAAGVLAPESPRLVVMPDDPKLGEFQEVFAGVLGVIMLYPQPVSDINPGFHGATEILGHKEFWELRQAGTTAFPDTQAFLRARLLDILFNDWDRHRLQWRWARIPDKPLLQPLPEDRDQVFSDFEGLALNVARMNGGQMVTFEEEYPSFYRITQNGWDLDRFLLTNIDKSRWMEIAASVQAQLTDEVIDDGLQRMPAEYYRLRGLEIGTKLKSRRDKILELAERYYQYLAGEVDVQCSNQSEHVIVQRLLDGGLEVSVATLGQDGSLDAPYFQRRFVSSETNEVRIYLHGGSNTVETRGKDNAGVNVRVIGGPGKNTVDDSQGFGVRFYASEGNNQVTGNGGTDLKSEPFTMPPRPQPENDTPWVPVQDWGGNTRPLFIAGYQSDPGFTVGAGFDSTRNEFRKYPWGKRHIVRGAFAFGAKKPYIDYKGDYRRENALLHYALDARFSGIDNLRYYGLGNETTDDLDDSAYKISTFQATVFPALMISRGGQGGFSVGPYLRYSDSSGTDSETVLGQEQPLGFGKYGELGAQARFRWDTREPGNVFASGYQVRTTGSYFFQVWDVEDPYGWIDAEVGGHFALTDHPVLLSLFVGGKKIWGDFPFYDAAYIGGGHTTPGYSWNRFGGDASLYGIAELRWAFMKLRSVVPGKVGVTGILDAGRVFLKGEDSSKWHPAYGGGVFYSPFGGSALFEIGVGSGDEGTFLVIGARMRGFGF